MEVVTDASKLQIAYKDVVKESFESQEDRLFGIYFHLLMGTIENEDELTEALDGLINSGQVDHLMREKIKDAAEIFFKTAKEEGLFEGLQKVLNEHPILVPTGRTLRPDRV